jgi:hypothetical protein
VTNVTTSAALVTGKRPPMGRSRYLTLKAPISFGLGSQAPRSSPICVRTFLSAYADFTAYTHSEKTFYYVSRFQARRSAPIKQSHTVAQWHALTMDAAKPRFMERVVTSRLGNLLSKVGGTALFVDVFVRSGCAIGGSFVFLSVDMLSAMLVQFAYGILNLIAFAAVYERIIAPINCARYMNFSTTLLLLHHVSVTGGIESPLLMSLACLPGLTFVSSPNSHEGELVLSGIILPICGLICISFIPGALIEELDASSAAFAARPWLRDAGQLIVILVTFALLYTVASLQRHLLYTNQVR